MNTEFDKFLNKTEIAKSDFAIQSNDSNPSFQKMEENSIVPLKFIILIIDDDPLVCDALKFTLEKEYDLILCSNGEEGIKKVSESVATVILDLKMEGKNGFDTFIEIKKIKPFIPIIFHSAYQDLKDPMEIMNEYRPFGYVIKGIESKQLLDTIKSAVDYSLQINRNAELIEHLQKKNKILFELQESLEVKVKQRTQELTLANMELHQEIEFRQKAENEIKLLLNEKEVLLQEVHHRIKNNMSTLKSLLSLQAGTLKEPLVTKALNEAGFRVQSMMVLYDKLYQSTSFEEMSVKKYIPALIEQIITNFPNYESVKITTKILDFVLDTKRLQSLGIIINELLTNAMKYAFTSEFERKIFIELSLKQTTNGNCAHLIIQDNGKGLPEAKDFKNSLGFGFKLIGILVKQLNGILQIERENGTRFSLEFAI